MKNDEIIFLVVDLSGRGHKVKRTLEELMEWDEVQEDEELKEWLEGADEGDERSEASQKFIRIE